MRLISECCYYSAIVWTIFPHVTCALVPRLRMYRASIEVGGIQKPYVLIAPHNRAVEKNPSPEGLRTGINTPQHETIPFMSQHVTPLHSMLPPLRLVQENLMQTINKVMESSAELLGDLRTASERREISEGAVSTPNPTPARGSRAKEMLSAVQGALEHGGVEPVSASEYSEPDSLDREGEGSNGSSRSSSSRGGGGGLLGRLREVRKRVVGRDGRDGDDVEGGNTTALAPMTGGDGVLADTLAWVQQVAGAQVCVLKRVVCLGFL